jgi:hypothetical protein
MMVVLLLLWWIDSLFPLRQDEVVMLLLLLLESCGGGPSPTPFPPFLAPRSLLLSLLLFLCCGGRLCSSCHDWERVSPRMAICWFCWIWLAIWMGIISWFLPMLANLVPCWWRRLTISRRSSFICSLLELYWFCRGSSLVTTLCGTPVHLEIGICGWVWFLLGGSVGTRLVQQLSTSRVLMITKL